MFYDVAVIGAGVFGAWSAYQLRLAGASVLLLDAYGPGNSRASSGGESRIIRLGYGPDEIYSRSSQRSFTFWQQLSEKTEPLFQKTGVLWLAREHDAYCEATLATLQRLNANFERLDQDELIQRFPQLEFGPTRWAILEPDSGLLMARRAVQAVVAQAKVNGVEYLEKAIAPPSQSIQGKLDCVRTVSGEEISAGQFVFACGPWLPKLFPELLRDLIYVTRQEVIFLGVPPGDDSFNRGVMPAWVDFNDLVYGIPNVDGRGFKIAIDAHGSEFDPDRGERVVSVDGLKAVREYVARRVPRLANAPVMETRVCQYENTSNGDFLIDRHPAFENVWIVGGGSGHGFKHGPVVGEYVARMMADEQVREPRFSLESKQRVQNREVF